MTALQLLCLFAVLTLPSLIVGRSESGCPHKTFVEKQVCSHCKDDDVEAVKKFVREHNPNTLTREAMQLAYAYVGNTTYHEENGKYGRTYCVFDAPLTRYDCLKDKIYQPTFPSVSAKWQCEKYGPYIGKHDKESGRFVDDVEKV